MCLPGTWHTIQGFPTWLLQVSHPASGRQAEADRGLWGYFPLPTLSGLSSQLLAFLKRQMFP